MSRNKYEIDMLHGSIMPKMLNFAFPLMISAAFQLLFNTVDKLVVGRFSESGSVALAAVGSTTALMHMIINLFLGLSIGANVLSARTYASGNEKKMSETVHTAVTSALIGGIIMVFAGLLLSKPALTLMETPEDVIDLSTLYMRICFWGMPFLMLYDFGSAVLRAVGDTKRPLIYVMISGALNVVLNLLFVIVFRLDVAGVAIATVISQALSCVLVLRCLIKTDAPYKLEIKKLSIKKEHLIQIFKIGFPAGLQSTLINFSNVLLQSSVNSFGSIAMAGYTTSDSVLSFLYMSANSITQAAMSFTGQNYGARLPKRMDRVAVDGIALQFLITMPLSILAYVFGSPISAVFTDDPEVVRYSVEILKVTATPYVLLGIMDTLPGILRGLGRSTVPMILCLIGTVGVRAFWICLVFPHNRTLGFLFLAYPLSWIVTIIIQLIYYLPVRKKIHRELSAAETVKA